MAVASTVGSWTLEEVLRLPDDGNRYELVRGELFVTPPPSVDHESIVARLNAVLVPFVDAQQLGYVHTPRSVVRFEGSQVEPDLMVRRPHPSPTGKDSDWTTWPVPLLVVEVASPYTRLRDRGSKRELYRDARVAEYWLVDPDRREIRVAQPGHADLVTSDRLTWRPAGAAESLVLDVARLFGN